MNLLLFRLTVPMLLCIHLQKLMNRRQARKDLLTVSIDDKITDRYYQKEAIRAVCEQIGQGFRKHLLVMATGTGKTRTAASLADVLSRGEHATNILFLADRTALVKQAKDGFKNYLPDMSLCNLCTNKDDRNARIVFSTYPTILNAIQNPKGSQPLFTPAHFDLIIIDESQNATLPILKMALTRIGTGSKMILTGDVTQIDLSKETDSGLQKCASILKNVDDIATISLTNRDVVRCKIVKDIVKAFEKEEAKAQEKTQKRAVRRTSR